MGGIEESPATIWIIVGAMFGCVSVIIGTKIGIYWGKTVRYIKGVDKEKLIYRKKVEGKANKVDRADKVRAYIVIVVVFAAMSLIATISLEHVLTEMRNDTLRFLEHMSVIIGIATITMTITPIIVRSLDKYETERNRNINRLVEYTADIMDRDVRELELKNWTIDHIVVKDEKDKCEYEVYYQKEGDKWMLSRIDVKYGSTVYEKGLNLA